MKIKILHLSDFHFKEDNKVQDMVLSSMSRHIATIFEKESKPNLIMITGDVAFGGKKKEYEDAKEFIDKVALSCEVENKNIFLIPGNHDVERSKIDPRHKAWWYNFKNENELNDVLTSEMALPTIRATTKEYFEFLSHYKSDADQIGPYGEHITSIPFGDKGLRIKVVCLNSALFCGYDGDDKKQLAIGLLQAESCEAKIKRESEIVITCIHHPFDCLHICETPSVNVVRRFSDIILSGHVHEANNNATTGGNAGSTISITSGAAYEKRTTQNGFNIIELDSESLNGTVVFYKYLPNEHLWIKNKDINTETDGVFKFTIKKGMDKGNQVKEIQETNPEDNSTTYMFKLEGTFDELNREKFKSIETLLKQLFNDVNGTIVKMERSSIKIFFETTHELSEEVKKKLKKIYGFDILDLEIADEKHVKTDKSVFHWKTVLRPEYSKLLESPGASFTHSRAEEELTLRDLYVSPNLRVIKLGENVKEKIDKVVNAEKALVKENNVPIKAVIYGAESSGKSTLVRWCYDTYYEQGYIPVFIEGNSIKDITIDKIKKFVQSEIKKQYSGIFQGRIEEFELDRIIVLIDDFHKIRFTKSKYKINLLSNLNTAFSNVIITGNDVMQFESYSSKSGGNVLDEFNRYQILEFGPKLRYELIKKWNAIGIEQMEPNELIRLNNETEHHVESIIGKNFVPSVPLYILTILQAREATTTQKPEFSMHGFYYELLINEALNKAVKNKADISLYYNYITEYCYFLFNSKIRTRPLYIDDFIKFHKQYCIDYKIEINVHNVIETLVNSKLMKVNIDVISISYRYVYYYFIAKYLANNISEEAIRQKVKLLCQRVHRDEFASIVMFLTHLTKDQFVLNELLVNSKGLFKDIAPLKLEEDVDFINEMILKIPDQVYKPLDVNQLKEEELKEKDELEMQEKEFNSEKDIFEYDIDEDINALDVLSTMIKALKTIEIIGQVTKKYWGELKAPQKFELAEETYMLGLRTLGFYFTLMGKDTEMLVEYLNHIYKKRNVNKSFSKEDVETASRNFLFGLCTMATTGIIKRVTNAIGYENLSGTFEDILKEHNYNSVRLIDTSIKLDHHKSFPWDTIKTLKQDTDKNYLSSVVLRNLVINYLYIFITSESDKQKLCELLGIKMDQLRLIDATSVVKKESN
jgi:predicted MPP superfamily phosphohydrolase